MERYQLNELLVVMNEIKNELCELTSLTREANRAMKESKELHDEVMEYARQRMLGQMLPGRGEGA